jgi:hypothetical protein
MVPPCQRAPDAAHSRQSMSGRAGVVRSAARRSIVSGSRAASPPSLKRSGSRKYSTSSRQSAGDGV